MRRLFFNASGVCFCSGWLPTAFHWLYYNTHDYPRQPPNFPFLLGGISVIHKSVDNCPLEQGYKQKPRLSKRRGNFAYREAVLTAEQEARQRDVIAFGRDQDQPGSNDDQIRNDRYDQNRILQVVAHLLVGANDSDNIGWGGTRLCVFVHDTFILA